MGDTIVQLCGLICSGLMSANRTASPDRIGQCGDANSDIEAQLPEWPHAVLLRLHRLKIDALKLAAIMGASLYGVREFVEWIRISSVLVGV